MKLSKEQRRIVKAALRDHAEGLEIPQLKALLSSIEGTVYAKLYQAIYKDGCTIEATSKRLYSSPRTITRLLERFYLRVWAVLDEGK